MIHFLTQFLIKDAYCYSALVDQIYISPTFLFYTHIPTAIISLVVGIFIFYRNQKNLSAKVFFSLTIFFFFFTLGDLGEWFAFLGRGEVMFARTIIQLIDPILFLLSGYFLYILIKKKDISIFYKIFFLLPILPELVMIIKGINLIGYNWPICEAIENPLLTNYVFYVDVFYVVSALIFAVWSVWREKDNRKEVTIASFGVCSFILLFFSMEYVLTGYIFGNAFDYSYFVYAFFGMPLLIIFLAYLIINFKTFQTKLISAEIFVFGIFSLIFFQYFFLNNTISFILNTIALVFSAFISNLLIKNVKREIEQKEKLAKLDIELENLIKERENLVHLVTHQVKGSFTRSKYIFAGILDGTFGAVNDEIKKRAEQGLESDNMGIETVDLVLSVANMEKGTFKYNMMPTDWKDIIIKAITEKSVSAKAKGLTIETAIKDGAYNVLGDPIWLKEVVNNLIENSIKYTKEGKIIVGLERKENKILFSVKDTGMGITPEDKLHLFTEGGQGKNSKKVNVDSTGYGLYSVKLVVEAHKGKVWAESEGEDKGSSFFVELDAI